MVTELKAQSTGQFTALCYYSRVGLGNSLVLALPILPSTAFRLC